MCSTSRPAPATSPPPRRRAARVLRSGGRAAFSVWDDPSRARLFGVVLQAFERAGAAAPADLPAGPPFFRFSADPEFERLLGSAGLDDVRIDHVAFDHRAPSADAIWAGFMEGTVRTRAILRGQPAATLARIKAEYERGVERYRSADGSVRVPVAVKIASGRKPPVAGAGP